MADPVTAAALVSALQTAAVTGGASAAIAAATGQDTKGILRAGALGAAAGGVGSGIASAASTPGAAAAGSGSGAAAGAGAPATEIAGIQGAVPPSAPPTIPGATGPALTSPPSNPPTIAGPSGPPDGGLSISETTKNLVATGLVGIATSKLTQPKVPGVPKPVKPDNAAALAEATRRRRQQAIASGGLSGTYKSGPLGIPGTSSGGSLKNTLGGA